MICSKVKQQIDQRNFKTIIRSQQPLECFVQLFTEKFRSIGSG